MQTPSRSSPFASRLSPLVLLLSLLVLTACGGDTDDTRWSVEHGALSLSETMRVSEGDGFYLGEIYDVAVRSDGRIYVADGRAGHVKVFGPEGTLRDSIGRQGGGPGEFERAPIQVTLARGDSLYVLDAAAREVSVFGPSHAFARQFSVSGGVPTRLFVPEGRSGFGASALAFGGSQSGRRTVVWRLDATGGVRDTIVAAPPLTGYTLSTGGTVRNLPVPHSRSAHVAMGPGGEYHYGWNDSLSVTTFGADGTPTDSLEIPFEPVPVTSEDRARELEGLPPSAPTAEIRQKIPSTKPAFGDFLVDDEGRYWFGRPMSHPDSTEWWVAVPDRHRVVTTTLPTSEYLLTVTRRHAYARSTNDDGAPVLVQYRVTTDD